MRNRRYRITTLGTLGGSWTAYFPGMDISTRHRGLTDIVGDITDQSALHGLLGRIRDMNLTIVSLLLLDDDGVTPVVCAGCAGNHPDSATC
jgi:hypothetical protein